MTGDPTAPAPHPTTPPWLGLCRALGGILTLGGAAGLLHLWLGSPPLFGFLRHLTLDGHETVGYILMIVIGVAVSAATDRHPSRRDNT